MVMIHDAVYCATMAGRITKLGEAEVDLHCISIQHQCCASSKSADTWVTWQTDWDRNLWEKQWTQEFIYFWNMPLVQHSSRVVPPSVPTILAKIWHPSICQETWAKWVSFKTLDVIVVVTGIGVVKQSVTGIHTILGRELYYFRHLIKLYFVTSGCGHASIPSGRTCLLNSHQSLHCSVEASSGWCFHPQWAHWEAPSRLCSSSASLCNVAIFLLYLLPWEPYSSCQSCPCCCKRSSKPLFNLDAITTPLVSVGTNTGSIIKTLRLVCSQTILKTQKTAECANWKSNKETFV